MLSIISKNKKGNSAQIVINNKGKSTTKHVVKRNDGNFYDKKGLPFNLNKK